MAGDPIKKKIIGSFDESKGPFFLERALGKRKSEINRSLHLNLYDAKK